MHVKFTSCQANEDCRPTKKDGTPSTAAFATGLALYYRIQSIAEAMVCGTSHGFMLVMHAAGGLKLRLYSQPLHEGLAQRIEREVSVGWADVENLKKGTVAA